MLMTDRRAGNNGKSVLLKLFESFFGGYSMKSVKFVCRGSFEQDRNSHDAGYQPLCGLRFLLADELKNSMTLDDALIKRVAGGPQEYVTGRMFNSGDRFSFLWQAGIVLAFNENDCPKFDVADAALLARMLVVPMRSKFVTDPAMVDRDELTFLMDADMLERSAAWMPAVLDVLRERLPVATAEADVEVSALAEAPAVPMQVGAEVELRPLGFHPAAVERRSFQPELHLLRQHRGLARRGTIHEPRHRACCRGGRRLRGRCNSRRRRERRLWCRLRRRPWRRRSCARKRRCLRCEWDVRSCA